MYRFIFLIIIIAILILLTSCGISNTKAKKGFLTYLSSHHYNKYEVITFKSNFNTANMNPNLFWVELALKENTDIVINFEWNAKTKTVHIPGFSDKQRDINSLTNYQEEEIVLRKEIHEVLDNDVVDMDVNVFNHAISITLETEPTLNDFKYFSNKICSIVENYPETWTGEAHIDFKLKTEQKGFYELVAIPNTYNDTDTTYKYRPDAIISNNYGSQKAEFIDHAIQQEYANSDVPVFLNRIWINQSDLNQFLIAFEKHELLNKAGENNHLTEGVGMYVVEMNYPLINKETLTYIDYETVARDDMIPFLLDSLPEDYLYLIQHS